MSNKSKAQQKSKQNPNKKQVAARNKRVAAEAAARGEAGVTPELSAEKKREKHKKLVRDIAVGIACGLLILAFGLSSLIQFCGANNKSTTTASASASTSASESIDYDGTFQTTVDKESTAAASAATDSSKYTEVAAQYMAWLEYIQDGTITSAKSTSELATQARDFYKKALDNNATQNDLSTDDYDKASVSYALATYYAGSTDDAISLLETFNQTTTNYPESWEYLGLLYEQKSDTAKAKECLQTALDLANSAQNTDLATQIQSEIDELG